MKKQRSNYQVGINCDKDVDFVTVAIICHECRLTVEKISLTLGGEVFFGIPQSCPRCDAEEATSRLAGASVEVEQKNGHT